MSPACLQLSVSPYRIPHNYLCFFRNKKSRKSFNSLKDKRKFNISFNIRRLRIQASAAAKYIHVLIVGYYCALLWVSSKLNPLIKEWIFHYMVFSESYKCKLYMIQQQRRKRSHFCSFWENNWIQTATKQRNRRPKVLNSSY